MKLTSIESQRNDGNMKFRKVVLFWAAVTIFQYFVFYMVYRFGEFNWPLFIISTSILWFSGGFMFGVKFLTGVIEHSKKS